MKKYNNLSQRSQQISAKLLKSLYLLGIFEDIIEGEGKLETLLKIIRKNIKFSFNEIENCRKIIS